MREKIGLVLAIGTLILLLSGCGGGGGISIQPPSNLKIVEDDIVKVDTNTYIRQITIEWEKVANAASYIVLRKKEGEANFSQIGETSALSYADKLTDGRDFAIDITYQVIAVASDGTKSQPSEEVKAENPSPPKPPF
jgi:fibronectin type 3 domain-containing protein